MSVPVELHECLRRWRVHATSLLERDSNALADEFLHASKHGAASGLGAVPSLSIERTRRFAGDRLGQECWRWLAQADPGLASIRQAEADPGLLRACADCLVVAEEDEFQPEPLVPPALERVSSFRTAFTWLLRMFNLRASPDESMHRQTLAAAIERTLRHHSDLVLALCWAHAYRGGVNVALQGRGPTPEGTAPGGTADLGSHPMPVYETVHSLTCALARNPIEAEELTTIGRELVQRFEDEGFEWTVVAPGAAYGPDISRDFDTFGHVAAGQPVTTLQAALLRNGTLKKRGLVRRLRPSEGN